MRPGSLGTVQIVNWIAHEAAEVVILGARAGVKIQRVDVFFGRDVGIVAAAVLAVLRPGLGIVGVEMAFGRFVLSRFCADNPVDIPLHERQLFVVFPYGSAAGSTGAADTPVTTAPRNMASSIAATEVKDRTLRFFIWVSSYFLILGAIDQN